MNGFTSFFEYFFFWQLLGEAAPPDIYPAGVGTQGTSHLVAPRAGSSL